MKQGDRLGVYLEETPTSVAYVFDGSDPTTLGQTVIEAVEKGQTLGFDALVFPYDFSVAAYIRLDTEGEVLMAHVRVSLALGASFLRNL